MQYREIKQHNIPGIISILALLIIDILAFYLAYCVAEYAVGGYAGIKYPFRVLLMIIILIYIFKRYNPSSTISRGHESKILIQLFYLIGIGYIVYKILSKSIHIDKAQYDLVFLHIFIFLDILFRLFVRTIQRYFLKMGFGGRRAIIIGKGEDAYHIADEINRNPSFSLNHIDRIARLHCFPYSVYE